MGKSQELYKKAKKILPGGTQLLSKRPEMFLPDLWPAYYDKAEGCHVWDLDGKEYIDMSYMGIGACILGYNDKDVNVAVSEAIKKGSMTTLNCPEEVELAELLCRIHPWAEMVRYARTGGEAMAIAVRIARAKAGKDLILFCGYHGWHDWYLSANLGEDKGLDGHLIPGLEPKGVPRGLKGTTIPFNYNDFSTFEDLIKRHKGNVAAVVMEPIRNHYPADDFLNKIRDITQKLGITLIFDEVSSGWRINLGGAHLKFGVIPDMAIFAKGISNGYPMAAVIGKADVMSIAEETFISSTYWTERIGPAAALATINKLMEQNVSRHLIESGEKIQRGWKNSAADHKLNISVEGIPPLAHFSFDHDDALILKTLFTQFMLEQGFLASTAFYASFAHDQDVIGEYLAATDEAFTFIANALRLNDPKRFLKGSICHAGFKRLT